MKLTCPDFLVESDWLEENLSHPDLRIIDCHFNLEVKGVGEVVMTSGLNEWQESHIPGSCYVDLQAELSDKNNPVPFMMPPDDQFAAVMSGKGIGQGKVVVIYDRNESTWAARLWWMLRAKGFTNAVLLNGGWQKWQAEGRPVTDVQADPKPEKFEVRPRPELIVDKATVLNSLGGNEIRICTLDREVFCRGHIPESINIASRGMIDPETKTFLPEADLRRLFDARQLSLDDPIIVYCGGGISASLGAFTLTMLGYRQVRLYDGSLEEWFSDSSLPVETTDN